MARQGKTLFGTSHILPDLARICQQVAIITHGTLRAYGTVAEIGRLVSQQRTIEAHLVSAEQVSLAADVIRSSIGPDDEVVEVHAEATVRFRTAKPEDYLARVLRRMFKEGILVSQFREVQTDLEEAFMSFTNSQPADADPIEEERTGATPHV